MSFIVTAVNDGSETYGAPYNVGSWYIETFQDGLRWGMARDKAAIFATRELAIEANRQLKHPEICGASRFVSLAEEQVRIVGTDP
jgi:hypothetical protein